jgi:hypothetical protein
MQVNRQQACGIFGLSRAEFDRLLPLGLPAHKKSSSRGQDWTIDTLEMHEFLVEQRVAKVRPRPRSGPDVPADPPPGWDAFQAAFGHALALEHPVDKAVSVALLDTLHELPRLIANVASDNGLPMDTVFRLSTELTVVVLALWSRKWPFVCLA